MNTHPSTSLSYIFYLQEAKTSLQAKKSLQSLEQQCTTNWTLVIPHTVQKAIPPSKNNIVYSTKAPTLQAILQTSTELNAHKDTYICILPAGTVLNSNTLQSLQHHQAKNFDLIYTDTLFDNKSATNRTHYKPDWNPDYFQNHNYLSPSLFIKFDVLKKAIKSSGQDASLHHALSSIQHTFNTRNVLHIPQALFSTPTLYQANLPKQPPRSITDKPLVSLIIPTKNQYSLLKSCIDSINNTTSYDNIEIIIIDNQSNEKEVLDYLDSLQVPPHKVRVIKYNKPFNYSAINNFAVKHATGSLIAFINNDIEVINKNWLEEMVYHALRPEIGCVGAKLYYPDGTIQHGGVILGIKGTASHAHKHFPGDHPGYFNRLSVVHNVSAVTAACLVMRKALFEEVEGFDDVNLKVAYNDVDLCLKVRELGYRNLWTPHAELIHHESKSRGKKRSWWQRRKLRKEARYLQQKWGDALLNDPAYNPNLTLDKEDFSPKEGS